MEQNISYLTIYREIHTDMYVCVFYTCFRRNAVAIGKLEACIFTVFYLVQSCAPKPRKSFV